MKLRAKTLNTIGVLALSVGSAGTLAPSPASAAVESITSSATVLDVSLNVLAHAIGPLYPASAVAPPAQSSPNGAASASIASGPLTVTTGLLSDTASGGMATSSLTNLVLTVKSGSTTYLGLTASAIDSTSSVNPTPSATGSASLSGATLTVLGSSIALPSNPTPNDLIYDSDGLTVLLNQQSPDRFESAGITTDAIAIDFIGFPVVAGPSLYGSIEIAQSFASIDVTPIPETQTWATMLIGFAALGYAGFRRVRSARSV